VIASELRRGIVIRIVQILVQFLVLGAVLLLAAGTWRWGNAWAFVGLSVLSSLGIGVYVLPRNPEVIVERGRRHGGTRRFDVVLGVVMTVTYLGVLVVAGLDAGRFGWTDLGPLVAVVGAVLVLLTSVPIAGAMAANRHLETTVRIQAERGHETATEGPYRFVRHPMYAAMLLQMPATALLLESAWALVPAAGFVVAMVVRTALEDRMLRSDLPGYAAYARTTRYRLVPRVW